MRVHIVCYEDLHAWILGKFALRLQNGLARLGVRADISKKPDPKADINHHIIYFNYDGQKNGNDTVMITHIDSDEKVAQVKSQLVAAEMGVCMSMDSVRQLALQGVPRERLCYVNPAHDEVMKPRRLAIGITSKVQPSGCKREQLLVQLFERISPDDFELRIMGAGWDAIVKHLKRRGFHVDYTSRFDLKRYAKMMPLLDYYLYLGMDEGSMGYVDALAAGVKTIVTTQGYHLDVPGGITHGFTDLSELHAIFAKLAEEHHARSRLVASWTWLEYARKHLFLWRYLLARTAGEAAHPDVVAALPALGIVDPVRNAPLGVP